jgi:hypothetical protein
MRIRWPAGRFAGVVAAPLALAAVLAGVAPAAASAAAAASCLPGAEMQPVSPGTKVNEFQGVAVLTACDAWAVGFDSDDPSNDSSSRVDKALIEHWDGTSWTVVPTPEPGSIKNELAGVRAVSSKDVWAVGFFDNGVGPRTFIVHWDGKAWTRVPSPNPSDSAKLTSVRFVSAKDGWAVGSFNDGTDHTLTLHWNGKAWKRVPSPSFLLNSTLAAVSVVSARNVWAVGQATTRTQVKTLILHWNGARWSRVASPNAGISSGLTGAAATSATNVWAVGILQNTVGSSQTLILHWNGKTWKRVTSPNPGGPAEFNQLDAVTASSASSARAVGTFVDPGVGQTTLIVQWNGSRWTHVVTPATDGGELLAVTGTSAASSWAVGDARDETRQLFQALAVHCC